MWGGALATTGGVVFYGTLDGWFKAVDARTGKVLWQFKVGSGVVGNPIDLHRPRRQTVRRDLLPESAATWDSSSRATWPPICRTTFASAERRCRTSRGGRAGAGAVRVLLVRDGSYTELQQWVAGAVL